MSTKGDNETTIEKPEEESNSETLLAIIDLFYKKETQENIKLWLNNKRENEKENPECVKHFGTLRV